MRVVFDQKLIAGNYPSSTVFFFVDLIKRMARMSPGDEFILLTPPEKRSREVVPENMYIVPTGNMATRMFGPRFLQKFTLPRIARSLVPDLFVGIDNPRFDRYPQAGMLLLIDPDSAEKARGGKPNDKKWANKLPGKYTAITFTDFAGSAIKMAGTTLLKLPPPFPEKEERLGWGRKESIKVQYSGGRDYFLFTGDLDSRYQLLELLKAFSQFKQRQQSGMQLYLAGKVTRWTTEFEAMVDTYKYRSDVIIMKNPTPVDIEQLMSAAYAFVYPASEDSFPYYVLKAVACGLPVICTEIPVIVEWLGDAAMYASGNTAEGFAQAMKLLFKDESQRDRLIGLADALNPNDGESLPGLFLDLLRKTSERK